MSGFREREISESSLAWHFFSVDLPETNETIGLAHRLKLAVFDLLCSGHMAGLARQFGVYQIAFSRHSTCSEEPPDHCRPERGQVRMIWWLGGWNFL